jgi:hypothetical protein
MTDVSGEPARPATDAYVDPAVPPATDRFEASPVPDAAPEAGAMLRFAGLVLGLTGIWHVVAGLVALTEESYYRTPSARLPVHVSYTTWGWVHLLIGALAVVAGFGVIAGNRLAAVVGGVLALVSAVVNLAFIRAEPFAAVMIIILDVLVLWGVTTQAPPPRSAP